MHSGNPDKINVPSQGRKDGTALLAGLEKETVSSVGNRYIDYERMGRDMDMSGDMFTIENSFDEAHTCLLRNDLFFAAELLIADLIWV